MSPNTTLIFDKMIFYYSINLENMQDKLRALDIS